MLGRVMPLLVLTGTIALATSEGPATVAKVQDAVRTLLQRSEIQESAKLLRVEIAQGNQIPLPGRADQLAQFLRETRTADASRDVTLDFWQHPLVLEREDRETVILLSWGPNGARDECAKSAESGPDSDDICEAIAVPRGAGR